MLTRKLKISELKVGLVRTNAETRRSSPRQINGLNPSWTGKNFNWRMIITILAHLRRTQPVDLKGWRVSLVWPIHARSVSSRWSNGILPNMYDVLFRLTWIYNLISFQCMSVEPLDTVSNHVTDISSTKHWPQTDWGVFPWSWLLSQERMPSARYLLVAPQS